MTSNEDQMALFALGQTVAVHPASDWFMRGIKFATITKFGSKWVTLHSALFGKTFKLKPRDMMEVVCPILWK